MPKLTSIDWLTLLLYFLAVLGIGYSLRSRIKSGRDFLLVERGLPASICALAFTAASIWSLPADVAPSPAHVASIGGIQNFAANIAGVVTTSFTGVMLAITGGSFVVPLMTAGGICLLGAVV